MIIDNMKQENVLFTIGCDRDTIKSVQFDSSFDFIFILEIYYLFKEGF